MDVMHGRRGRIHSETNTEFCCLENKNSYEIHSMLSNIYSIQAYQSDFCLMHAPILARVNNGCVRCETRKKILDEFTWNNKLLNCLSMRTEPVYCSDEIRSPLTRSWIVLDCRVAVAEPSASIIRT